MGVIEVLRRALRFVNGERLAPAPAAIPTQDLPGMENPEVVANGPIGGTQ